MILILASARLLVNKNARTAATSLGLTILLTVLWIYLPLLLAAHTNVVALDFFFDTLLFCGAICCCRTRLTKNQRGADLVLNQNVYLEPGKTN